MSNLEDLKERLKRKPEVRPNEGVRVVIAPQIKEDIKINVLTNIKPIITSEKDEGKRAQDILEKIKKQKLTAVIRKFPEEEKATLQSKAPVLEVATKIKPKQMQN